MKRNPKQLIGLIGLICCIVLIIGLWMRTDAPADPVVDLQSALTSSNSSSGQKSDSETPQSSGTTEDFGNFLPAPELTWLTQLDIPAWSGKPYVEQNGNVPFFETDNIRPEPYEIYYDLDSLGRCTLADAVAGPETQPREKRGNIGSVHPTGWHKDRYSFVEGEALYNRCHLIAYYLTAENANPRNLVTGTSYMNRRGMNDFENLVGDYIKETGNHVRYRVTPVWTADNLVCDGLLVEGWSIEDEGDGICFCIYAYNVEPGIHIDYQTGDNYAEEGYDGSESTGGSGYSYGGTSSGQQNGSGSGKDSLLTEEDITGTYVLNKKSRKFHYPDCEGAIAMSEKNREEYTGSRNELIIDGYTPCPECQP